MIRNYIKIAWRNLKRNSSYAIINVCGLSLGIACSILIFTLVSFHLSFDNFHKDGDRIVRIVTDYHSEITGHTPGIPVPVGKAFRTDYADLAQSARVTSYDGMLVSLPGDKDIKKFDEKEGVVFTEPDFFQIMNFPLLNGDARTAMTEPNSALITQKMATKYFGNDDPMGKIIRINNKSNFKITGILKDFPKNTDFVQQIYFPFAALKEYEKRLADDSAWQSIYSGSQFYAKVQPGVSNVKIESDLKSLVYKYYKNDDQKFYEFKVQPLNDIHYNPDYTGYLDKKYLWALALIGLFLVVTASVNFINLATAQALNRSREIGVRKVMGSQPAQIFWQFIAETALITVFAAVLGYVIAWFTLPFVNELFEIELSINLFRNWAIIVFLFVIFCGVTFLSGSYPGLVLSRFQPVAALKGKISQKSVGGFSLRKLLVITQFGISQLLIIVTIVISTQINFAQQTNLGFNKDAVLMIPIPEADKSKMNALRNELKSQPGVENMSFCFQAPASTSNNTTGVVYDSRPKQEPFDLNIKDADPDYLSTFGMQLVAGRNLFPADSTREFLVNETFVKKLHLSSPQELIGKTIAINGKSLAGPVVGVVKDFFNYSFRVEKSPTAIRINPGNFRNCAIKINMANRGTLMPFIEQTWNKIYPLYVYNSEFLDDRVAKMYQTDNTLLKMVKAFCLVAIFIGCLGLYGLVSFLALRKTKEIGVRKVLGAGVPQILWIFGKEFSRLLLIAFVIAAPLAWYAMHLYLSDFAYQIPIGPGIFVLAILVTFVVALLSVGYRSLRAAFANPVTSLRSE